MKRALIRNFCFYGRNLCLSRSRPNPSHALDLSSRSRFRFYSHGTVKSSRTHEKDDAEDSVDSVSKKDLKKEIDKFLKGGDAEAIPSIFEAILKRKLSKLQGKCNDSDDELMEEICGKKKELSDVGDEEYESGSDELCETSEDIDNCDDPKDAMRKCIAKDK